MGEDWRGVERSGKIEQMVDKDKSQDEERNKKREEEEKKILELAAAAEAKRKAKPHWSDETQFNAIIGVVIVLNTALVGLETEYGDEERGASENTLFIFVIINQFLAVFYFVEMLLRIKVHRLAYFQDLWFIFDFTVTLVCVLENWVLIWLDDIPGGIKSFTTLRLLRIIRVVRLVRVFFLFRDLWFALRGMVKVSIVLFWMAIVLFLVFSAIAPLCSLLISPEEDVNNNFTYIFFETHMTLLKMVTMDDWSKTIVRPLIEKENYFMTLSLVFFMMVSAYGFMSIVLGITVFDQDKIAEAQRMEVADKIAMSKRKALSAIKEVFIKYDSNKSGTIEYSELAATMDDPKFASLFKRLGFPNMNARSLFITISETGTIQGSIGFEEFIKGCSQLLEMESSADKFFRAAYKLKWMNKVMNAAERRTAKLTEEISEFGEDFETLYESMLDLNEQTTDPLVKLRKQDLLSANSTLKTNKARNARRRNQLAQSHRENRVLAMAAKEEEERRIAEEHAKKLLKLQKKKMAKEGIIL